MIKKGMSASLQVRSEGGNGKRLFDWNPSDRTVSIINRGIRYVVKLTLDGYTMLEERPKGNEHN